MKAVMILLISLFLISCSRVEPKDAQETPSAPSASIDAEKEAEFNEVANQFGSLLVLPDTASMYDVLKDEKKLMLTKDEFSRRYSKIYKEFGLESAQVRTIAGSGEKRDVTYYLNYDDGNVRASEHFGFSLVDGRWRFEGMKDLFYAFCEKDLDCNPDVLTEVCDKTCASTGDLRKLEKASLWCSNFVCACKCLRLRGGVEVYPNWNLLENPNIGVVTKEVRPDLGEVKGKL